MIIEMLKVFFIPFFSMIRAVFSVIHSFLPFYNLVADFNNAFSIDYILCGILGMPLLFAFVFKFIRKHIKSLKN